MAVAEKSAQRTCIACRQTGGKKQLVRYVVAPDGELLVDYRQRLPGRGAYTCVTAECLQAAVKRNSFQRSFKGRCRTVDVVELQQQLVSALDQRIIGLIGMSRKSGQFVTGTNAVIESLRRGTSLALVVIAADISATIGKKIETLAKKNSICSVRLYDKQTIGQMLGKEERSVIAIPSGLLADSLLNELHRYRQLVREN